MKFLQELKQICQRNKRESHNILIREQQPCTTLTDSHAFPHHMTALLAIQGLHYTPHTALFVRNKKQSSYTSNAFVFPLRSLHH